MLTDDRRCKQSNSVAVAYIDFSLWVKKQLTTPGLEPWTSRSLTRSISHSAISPVGHCCYAAIVFILATSFTSEREQWRSLKIEERNCKKVT